MPPRRRLSRFWVAVAGALAGLCVFGIAPMPVKADGQTIHIGALAFRGTDLTLERWQPTVDYLGLEIPDHAFSIVPLSLDEMTEAVRQGKVQFVLTNPGNYVYLEAEFGVTRIATLKPSSLLPSANVFGAVIVVRADNTAIQTLADLRDKKFMAVDQDAFGGFQMAWREMAAAGVDPFDDLASLTFGGFPQDQIIQAVINGKVDAGTVRTGVIESMAREGRVNPADLRVLNFKRVEGFPYRLSTRLYPEWPFAKLKNVSPEIAQRVVIALLSLSPDHPAVKKGNYAGWTVPLDYHPVHELFRELRIGPYGGPIEITFDDLMGQYGHWGVFAAILTLIGVMWVVRVEQIVSRRTVELSNSNLELERQIVERRRAEEIAQRRQDELAHVSRVNTMGELTAGLAHEINQPLSAIANYAQGCVRRLKSAGDESSDLLGAMQRVTQEAERASAVIRRIRSLVRKSAPVVEPVNINDIIADVMDITAAVRMRHGISTTLNLNPAAPVVMADRVQIEQVLLNLVGNGIDALKVRSGTRQLVVSSDVGSEDDLTVSVTDNGVGLPAESMHQVFDMFFSTKPDGMGMGLAISHTIIEAHGGRLWAGHGSNGGAVLAFSIPSASRTEVTRKETAHNAA